MNFSNIDPMLGQVLSQVINMRGQISSLKMDTSVFLSAMDTFANAIGAEMQKQALSGVQTTDLSAAAIESNSFQGA